MPRRSSRRQVAFKDGAILLCLVQAELLPLWFRLGMPTFTTDLVTFEIEDSTSWPTIRHFVDEGFLRVESISGPELEELENKFDGIGSPGERSVLHLADLRDAHIVSGVSVPLSFPEELKGRIENGVWVLDRLVEEQLLEPQEALSKIETLALLGCPVTSEQFEHRKLEWAA